MADPTDFPNYFEGKDHKEITKLLENAFESILKRLKIIHRYKDVESKDDFFSKILKIVKDQDSGAKVYISGGVTRSILGYIYKKIWNSMQKDKPESHEVLQDYVEDILYRIILGASSKLEKSEKGGFSFTINQELSHLDALGVSSDMDILIDFSLEFTGDKKQVEFAVKDFINSEEIFLGKKGEQGLKKVIFPVADVKEYKDQIERASGQGGSTLDWMAFDIESNKFRFPEKYPNILEDFLNGVVEYIPPFDGSDVKQKQTIRGLRPLLEIPSPFQNTSATPLIF